VLDDASVAAFLDACGGVTALADLTVERGRLLGTFLQAHDDVGAQLLECRRAPGAEWLILEIDVDVGQAPVVDIRRQERIAVGFGEADAAWPEVAALRADFPTELSHLNLRPKSQPVSLCLSEAPWEDAQRRWTSGTFIRLLRTWLIDTARGALHREDQVLEPFLLGSSIRAILPADILGADPTAGRALYGYGVGTENDVGPPVYRFTWEMPPGLAGLPGFAAVALSTPRRVHGVIPHTPRTLGELSALLQADDFDFVAALDAAAMIWFSTPQLADAHPVLLIHVSIVREAGGPAERDDLWAFLLATTVRDFGEELDLYSKEGGRLLAAYRRPGPWGADILIDVMNPCFELTSERAAAYNGYGAPSGKRFAAIGAGALGSQVLANLTRMGETITAVADNDRLLPHNMARHAVWDHHLVGWPKAKAAALMIERLTPTSPKPQAIEANAAAPMDDPAAAFATALAGADLILDLAASVPVSRRLALDAVSDARRISAFLSPTGRDLVILAEDHARTLTLDQLELGYYGSVAQDDRLAGHFELPANTRYARSCREVTAQLPQTFVALHAAIAADIVRRVSVEEEPLAAVWRIEPTTMTVSRCDLDIRPMLEFSTGGWRIFLTEALIETLKVSRSRKLPAETGGVLIGDFDIGRRRIYLISSIPSPEDSKETPGSYIRGSFGLQQAVRDVGDRTLNMLQYVGEWHSHPDGASANPSGDDLALYVHLTTEMQVEGYPPVMLIIADGQMGLLIDGEFSDF
jgi:hypothetical protein